MRAKSPRYGAARAISKLGLGSRTQAAQWLKAGRVRINGRVVTDPEFPVNHAADRITVDGLTGAQPRLVIMLNKPRGLVTTTRDEQDRETVYRCFAGRAARVTGPSSGPDKTYHVQIDRVPNAVLIEALKRGANVDGEVLRTKSARCLRSGQKHGWLEITLDEGRNRHIRRLLSAFDIAVLRLVRVCVGNLQLGQIPKGGWRVLTEGEIESLVPAAVR